MYYIDSAHEQFYVDVNHWRDLVVLSATPVSSVLCLSNIMLFSDIEGSTRFLQDQQMKKKLYNMENTNRLPAILV